MAWDLVQIAYNKHKTIILCVDRQFADDILPYLLDTKVVSEFIKIKDIILEGLRNKHLYQKMEGINAMYEMRFTNKGRNDRIYCKELSKSNKKYIVLIKFYQKKSQNIPKDIKQQLQKIAKYEYDI